MSPRIRLSFQYRLIFLYVVLSMGLCSSFGADAEPDARTAFERLTTKMSEVTAEFFIAVAHPNSQETRALPAKLRQLREEFRSLPNPPNLPTAACAERDRSLAFLRIAEARLYGASTELTEATAGVDYRRERTQLASDALNDIESARSWLAHALAPSDPDYSDAMKNAIEQSQIGDHLNALAATAHSIIWVINQDPAAKRAAADAWNLLSGDYRRDYFPPAPEVVVTLDLDPVPIITGAMTAIAWVGIGLLLLGLGAAFFVSPTDLFQQWAVRVVFAIGAAMTGTVITGLLHINIPQWGVVAGGALAIIILIYLINPPSIK